MDKDPQSDSSTVVTALLIAVPLIIYLLYFICSKKKGSIYGVRGRRELLLRAQGCSSAECVRCTKYQIVREEALEKFRLFQEGYGTSGLDRVSASLDDMRGLPTDPSQQPNVLYVPGLKCSPLWNDGSFSRETKLLERQWLDIRNEFERARADIRGWKRNSTEDDSGGWTIFCLYNQGEKIEKNCSLCPKTTAVVESMSSFMRANVFGNAMFSVVEPGTKIAEHYGPCNIRIRCHLGTYFTCSCVRHWTVS